MKKKIAIIVISILLLISGYFMAITMGILNAPAFLSANSEEMTDLEKVCKILKETKPTELFILGKDITFEVDVEYRKIDKLSADLLNDTDKEYKVIIINDLDNSVSISNEEIEAVNAMINKDGTMVLYLGEKYATVWDNPEYSIANVDGNLSYEYYSWNGEARRSIGAWNKNDQNDLEKYPDSLGQSILYCIEEYIQEGDN